MKAGRAVLTGVVCLLLAAPVLWVLGQYRYELAELPARLTTAWSRPGAGRARQLRRPERRALRQLGRRFRGSIVWSSNRSGNHELYSLELQPGQLVVRQLTHDPYVEFGSRYSPDGSKIAFARSRRPWVSFRDERDWDVYVMDADGSHEYRVAEFGYRPVWGPNGESLLFPRDGKLIEVSLADGKETVRFDAAAEIEGRAWGDPSMHSSGTMLALSVARYGAVVRSPSGIRRLTESQVCQTSWIPGTRDLVWVQPQGNGGTRIIRASADGSHREVLMDLPGQRSHEYFPTVSNDGQWLVWGAAAHGHEHDRADYEIFIWHLGDPWDRAVRLTYHSGNDQWPDVFVAPLPGESATNHR